MRVLSRMHGALYSEHVLCGAKAHIPISGAGSTGRCNTICYKSFL